MITKILCAIDDQEHSRRAAAVAIDLATKLTAELVFGVVNPAILPGRGACVYLWSDDYVRKIAEEAVQRARRCGLWDVRRETGRAIFAEDGIVAFAEMHRADFIVIGARERWGVIGRSISRAVAAKANCPVLIVKRVRGEGPSRPGSGLLERLFGYRARTRGVPGLTALRPTYP